MVRIFDPTEHFLKVNVIRAKPVFQALNKPKYIYITMMLYSTISYFHHENAKTITKSFKLPSIRSNRKVGT